MKLNIKSNPAYVLKEEKTCELHGKFACTYSNSICSKFVPYGDCPDCFRTQQAQKYINASGIRRRYISETLDTYLPNNDSQANALAVAKSYADDVLNGWGGSLLLLGPCGTGKTHIACGILNQCCNQLCHSLYTTAREIILEVRSSWRSNAEQGEVEVREGFSSVPVLVIDELGAQSGTENELQILFDILDARYAEMLPTIVCSNLNGEKLKAMLGQRIMDRLRDNGKVVPVTGESQRKLAA